jgi:hypothetical protein
MRSSVPSACLLAGIWFKAQDSWLLLHAGIACMYRSRPPYSSQSHSMPFTFSALQGSGQYGAEAAAAAAAAAPAPAAVAAAAPAAEEQAPQSMNVD